MLRVLLEEHSIAQFEALINNFIVFLNEKEGTSKFGKYFEEHYKSRAKQWAYCYRYGAGINTNMYVEAFHKVIKYVYRNGKQNKRVDNLLHVLTVYVRDKAFDRLIKIHKGKSTGRITKIKDRHVKAQEVQSLYVVSQVCDNQWEVTASESNKNYIVVCDSYSCDQKCSLTCKECGICVHMYSCTCPDALLNTTICKHIHLVCINNLSSQVAIDNSVVDDVHEREVETETILQFVANQSSVTTNDDQLK